MFMYIYNMQTFFIDDSKNDARMSMLWLLGLISCTLIRL